MEEVEAAETVQRMVRGHQTRRRVRRAEDGVSKVQRRVRTKKTNSTSSSEREKRLAKMRSELLKLKALRASSRKRRENTMPKSPGEIRKSSSGFKTRDVVPGVLKTSAANTIQRSWRRRRRRRNPKHQHQISPQKLTSRNIVLERQAQIGDEDETQNTKETSISILRLRDAFVEVTKYISSSSEGINNITDHHNLREILAKQMIKLGSRKRTSSSHFNLACTRKDLSILKQDGSKILKQIGELVMDPKRARDELQMLLRPWSLPKQRRVLLKMMQEHDIALRASRKYIKDEPWWRVRGIDSKVYDLRRDSSNLMMSQDMKRLCDEAERILLSKSSSLSSSSQKDEKTTEDEDEDSMWWITHCSPSLSKTLYSNIKKDFHQGEKVDFWGDVSTTARDLVSRVKQSREYTEQIFSDLIAEKEYRSENQYNAACKLQRFFRRAHGGTSVVNVDSTCKNKSDEKEDDEEENHQNDKEDDLPMDICERLVQLASLRERDLLTDQEFKAAKRVVLNTTTT